MYLAVMSPRYSVCGWLSLYIDQYIDQCIDQASLHLMVFAPPVSAFKRHQSTNEGVIKEKQESQFCLAHKHHQHAQENSPDQKIMYLTKAQA